MTNTMSNKLDVYLYSYLVVQINYKNTQNILPNKTCLTRSLLFIFKSLYLISVLPRIIPFNDVSHEIYPFENPVFACSNQNLFMKRIMWQQTSFFNLKSLMFKYGMMCLHLRAGFVFFTKISEMKRTCMHLADIHDTKLQS